MLKRIAAITAMLFAVASYAAVDANKGTASEIDTIKGIGPAMSERIVEARKQGEFKNWDDFMARVKGVKDGRAAKLSAEGLTINGQAYAPMAPAAKAKAPAPMAAAPTAPAAAPPAMAAPAKAGK